MKPVSIQSWIVLKFSVLPRVSLHRSIGAAGLGICRLTAVAAGRQVEPKVAGCSDA
jgi:hypothetical protein